MCYMEKKDCHITMRVTEKELFLIDSMALGLGLSRSETVRTVVMDMRRLFDPSIKAEDLIREEYLTEEMRGKTVGEITRGIEAIRKSAKF